MISKFVGFLTRNVLRDRTCNSKRYSSQKSSVRLFKSLSGSFFCVNQASTNQQLISFSLPDFVFFSSSALFVYIDKLGKHASGMQVHVRDVDGDRPRCSFLFRVCACEESLLVETRLVFTLSSSCLEQDQIFIGCDQRQSSSRTHERIPLCFFYTWPCAVNLKV